MTSSSTLTVTERWLHQVLGPYAHRDFVFADVGRTLSTFGALAPKTDTYIYDDGRTELLLCLNGTLPIAFKSATYNIPVAFWLPYDYPKSPPIAYVVPTATMLVRPSKVVDVSGRVGGEYLAAWSRKSEGCNLAHFCELLQAVFSREPPLYAKPSSSVRPGSAMSNRSPSTPPSASNPNLPPRPAPLPPGVANNNGGSPHRSPVSPTRPPLPEPHRSTPPAPPRPPLPQEPVAGPSRHQSMPSYANGILAQQARNLTQSPPSYSPQSRPLPPPRPPLPTLPGSPNPSRPGEYPQRPIPPAGPYGYATPPPISSQMPSQPPPPPQQQQQQQQQPAYHPAPPPPPPAPARNLLDEPDDVPSPTASTGSGTSAPARPVNPELLALRQALHAKLDHSFAALAGQHTTDAESLAALGHDLAQGGPALADEMARLEAVRDVCVGVQRRYEEVVGRAEAQLAEVKARPEVEVDEIVCSTTVVYNQLLDLVAEDHAIEDTCYQLYSALNADPPRIDLDKFLKRVRALAREQAVKRALVNKIVLEMAIRPPR